jgi:hypothetical protein
MTVNNVVNDIVEETTTDHQHINIIQHYDPVPARKEILNKLKSNHQFGLESNILISNK